MAIFFLVDPPPIDEESMDTTEQQPIQEQQDTEEQPEESSLSITTEEVNYYDETTGYLARPEAEGEYPALVLIHEWWGLNDNIRSLARDFARQGYVALAVDLYNGEVTGDPDVAGELAGGVRENTDPAFDNLQAGIDFLSGQEFVDQDNLASVGWCFGGQWAFEMAKNDLGVDASVMYYGQFNVEDDFSNMRADILGHFGEEDTSIAVDDVHAFEAKLNTLAGDHQVFIYPNIGHAFANEDNPDSYDSEAAEQAWGRTLDFLSRNLGEQ